MDILNQLGGLLLGSVPTILLFILVVVAYTLLVQKPLLKTLEQRRALTSGAVERARESIAAAEAETAVYEDKLRTARAEVQAERAARLGKLQAEREAALRAAREGAGERVRKAKAEIDASTVVARQQIEGAAAQLSESVLRAVLPADTHVAEAQR